MLVPLFPPPPPLSDFSPTINLTFWVSMGMNSQPPIPPCPAYPRLLISPWILQLAYSLYPLVTRGHQRPPPHTAGKFNPAYTRHGQPYPQPSLPPLQPLPCAPTPPPQWPSLSANYLDSCCVPLPPPPPCYSNPAFPTSSYLLSPSGTPDWGPFFYLFYLPPTYFMPPFTSPSHTAIVPFA